MLDLYLVNDWEPFLKYDEGDIFGRTFSSAGPF